jgi:hypothetical protein
MLVGQGDDEAVETVLFQLLAKGGEAVGVAGLLLPPLGLSLSKPCLSLSD